MGDGKQRTEEVCGNVSGLKGFGCEERGCGDFLGGTATGDRWDLWSGWAV